MKIVFQHIICAFVTILYVVAHIGCGIHICHEEDAVFLVPLIGDTSTEAIHAHHHDHHHDCPKAHTGACKGCHGCDSISDVERGCDTNIYVVTDAQNSENEDIVFTPESHVISIPDFCGATAQYKPFDINVGSAPPLIAESSPARLSVWRL